MSPDWLSYGPLMLKAAALTLWLSWLAMLIGAVGGTAIALMRTSRFRMLRLAALLYTEFFRSVPILIVMFFCYFGVPLVFGTDVSSFAAATVALALHASSTMSEVVRAGIQSVGRGQWEAAQAAGMDRVQVMRYIVGPQAIRVVLPPSVGVFITTLKESSLASIIGFIELTKTGLLIRESTDGGIVPLLALAVLYFLINYAISLVGARLERRFHIGARSDLVGAMG
ncbi:MAG TPA: amino acid ABC transporter permease [Aliidongia sp.]|uniref:amino acid ABC transporter permease n=1 Tax=Aliidongia sp. TaxID=1914230 RepID=UPI002DDD0C31|nr:amino acid ABC transporter permease [Aliidongia sp.]HEV2675390.1 amino acid ABC transporter permease [Aliidongia sp.]